MSTNNSLAAKKSENKVVEYDCGSEKVRLSPSIIRNYLVSGNGSVTDQEVVMFLNLCRFQHLNPFLREAYLIKFGNSPATMVTGKEVFTKRAKRNPSYRGFEAGIIVLNEQGEVVNRVGTFKLDNEKLVGGWAKVYIEGFTVPTEITVSLDEYIGTKGNGEINAQWSKKPATMIRKVAMVQALREAFPDDFQGMYSQEEVDIPVDLETEPVEAPTEDEPQQNPTPEKEPEPQTDDYDPLA